MRRVIGLGLVFCLGGGLSGCKGEVKDQGPKGPRGTLITVAQSVPEHFEVVQESVG
ncbi:MAG: hypothetical protein HY760_08370 [Nitrospirae bacterium]|nr:hypothetical protein [Nitrospirota bacterium]